MRRLPKVEGLILEEPSNLAKKMVLIWLSFFMASITRAVPPEERFQFLRIFAGSTPIHPSESQETGREVVERDGKVITVLVFENEVKKCHRVGGMTYKQAAIDFANHVAFGSTHMNATSAPPAHWLSLPTAGPNGPTVAISEEELGHLTSLASDLPETAKTRVLTLIEAINAYQEHLPAMHPFGIWLCEDGIPLVFARTPQEASRPWTIFWLPPDYFLPPGQGQPEGTLYFFEVCQDELLKGDMILHKPSKTFYGGYTGVVSMARALIQIYLNCLAVRGDFQPPEPVPVGYDISRFNVQELGRIAGWVDNWSSIIKRHTEILSETSAERKSGWAHAGVRSISKDSDDGNSGSSDSDSEGFGPNTNRAPISLCSASTSSISGPLQPVAGPSKPVAAPTKPVAGRSKPSQPPQPVPGPSKLSKGKQRETPSQFASLDETEDEGSGTDYDVLDVTSQDDKSSDEEEWNRFNERFLDDDTFSPDDSIGLLERYGWNTKVDTVFHAACEPYEAVPMQGKHAHIFQSKQRTLIKFTCRFMEPGYG
ncbi:hypothetical protein RSAG8_13195, partial [Rhizoctonia solani AG-8 WAC10335]